MNMYTSGSVSDLIQNSDKSGQACFRRCKKDQVARTYRGYHNWYYIVILGLETKKNNSGKTKL